MSWGRFLRIGIGIVVIILCIVLNALDIALTDIPDNVVEYPVYTDNCPSAMTSTIHDNYFGNLNFESANSEDAKFIFTENKDLVDANKFKQFNILYSPIVMVFPDSMFDDASENFSAKRISSNYNCYSTDLKPIIMKLIDSENNKIKLADLGYKDAPKEVQVAIPDSGCYYRKDVINALIMVLTDGEGLSSSNVDTVKDQLDTLLSKVVNVKNPQELQVDTDKYILIIPEYLAIDRSGSTAQYVYYDECYAIPMYMMVRNDVEQTDIDTMLNWVNNSDKVLSKTGFRNDIVQYRSNYMLYMPTQVNKMDNQNTDNFEELLGKHYWR